MLSLRTAFCALLIASSGFALERISIWPGQKPATKYEDKGFALSVDGNDIVVRFTDRNNSDDYMFIDLGVRDLSAYRDGGYIEVTASIDSPILRISHAVAEVTNFWPTKQALEGEVPMKTGAYTYRLYLDMMAPSRAAKAADTLYLFLHDLGGPARGGAEIRISSITIVPPEKNWREAKREQYRVQYNWPTVDPVEPLYYEHFENAVDWPSLSNEKPRAYVALNGAWKRAYVGEHMWDYTFLSNTSFAEGAFDASSWQDVSVPEPAAEDQPGGFYWYRKEFDMPAEKFDRALLRFEDIADTARIYVNGRLVGSQSSTQKQQDWVAENGSRFPFMNGVPLSKAIAWRNFDRSGIPCPFDTNAIPDGHNRLILPIFFGDYYWPFAYDITKYLVPGKNVIAVRVYGHPMRGWWIYKKRYDRGSKNIYGILGDASISLYRDAVLEVTRSHPKTAVNGMAQHVFECDVGTKPAGDTLMLRAGDKKQTAKIVKGQRIYRFSLEVPARFEELTAVISLMAGAKTAVERTIAFHGTVVELRGSKLFVNGEPFFIRGINAALGVEWNNNRTMSKREYERMLDLYARVGVNAVRLEGAEPYHFDLARERGFMAMPVTCGSSTDLSMGIFGQLVSPDYRIASDRHRLLSIYLNDRPNILFWNIGNENHHTGGYDDRTILSEFLPEAQKAVKQYDPYKHMTLFANLDMWHANWFFDAGQDIIGWNIYKHSGILEQEVPEVAAAFKRPILFTEWGIEPGEKARKGKIPEWEAEMRGKWKIITETPASLGAFLFAFHGELDDAQGIAFLEDLFLPFTASKSGADVTFRNRSEAAMRDVRIVPYSDGTAGAEKTSAVLAPGQSITFTSGAGSSNAFTVSYETHGGLIHRFTRVVQ